MCNIAGYTGNKRAAPILIEMLRREQYIDGGACTGIATIHEGKLYHRKVVGDLDVLLRETDALDLPGTTGIAHSRPGGSIQSHAHPFVDKDEDLAMVLNGTTRDNNTDEFLDHQAALLQSYLDKGWPIRTAIDGGKRRLSNGLGFHPSELWTFMVGDIASQTDDKRQGVIDGTAYSLNTLPADIVMLNIHRLLDDTITAGRITRPMVVGIGDGESYAATTALAFPKDAGIRNIVPVPVCSVTQITPGAVHVTDKKLDNVRVEECTARMYAMAYQRLEAILIGQKDSPKSIYDFGFHAGSRDMWSEPYVDSIHPKEDGLLKPTAALMYETLWAFECEGRLHQGLGERSGHPITTFWID